ncbi:hypothetical protein CTEN210_11516 [Chaetoceros tenuissimus]|uniref:MYND-type domain-containing protein n=1 Tax=Chaetoceros tenuissimus TaxID=426638 RepID=A0AAD3H974_9STRA|nr:hypothetical protein CTEN210_11516 [Chaetoceros tenuissimus]
MSKLKLRFYSDWETCSACSKPPEAEKKLLTCQSCKSAAYHNVSCQQLHWKQQGHNKQCKLLKRCIQPLKDLAQRHDSGWWIHISAHDSNSSNTLWKNSCQLWEQQDYLNAMEGFQRSLEPYLHAWNNTTTHQEGTHEMLQYGYLLQLAERLLFLSYCELDGNQIELARNHLVMSISLLLQASKSTELYDERVKEKLASLLNDSWMELMLSFEEENYSRILARQVAHMAISTGTNVCGWKHALQRPGYMVPSLPSQPYTPSEDHPSWCRILEDNWEQILNEYMALAQSKSLSAVGSGDRGSGHDDHRVVAVGSDWKEYVLFGTGSSGNDHDAPITKGLLRQHVPDAISLAEQGGGEVIFSRLASNSHIQSHCAPTNFRLTAHLGLIVPPDMTSKIRVGSKWHTWTPGKILLFDDSFEHEVRNDSDQERVVLLIRSWHPHLSSDLRENVLYKARMQKENAIEKRYDPPN